LELWRTECWRRDFWTDYWRTESGRKGERTFEVTVFEQKRKGSAIQKEGGIDQMTTSIHVTVVQEFEYNVYARA